MITEIMDSQQNLPFHPRRRDVFSQCGEDGVVEYLLDLANIRDGYFVEFGAWDGHHLSNCANLAEQGWAGCFIEGNGERFLELRKNYAARADISTVNAFVGAEGDQTLASILKARGAPSEPTIVSIDIDGMDYHVWASLTAYQPLLCVVEFNPTIPARVAYVQEKDEAVHRGASLRALWRLAQQKGYALVAATDWNAFFMREDLCQAQAIPTYAPEQVKDPRYETLLFQGFDGTLFAAGSRKLLWHGVEIGETELQVLPPQLRHYPPCAPAWYSRAFTRFKRTRSG